MTQSHDVEEQDNDIPGRISSLKNHFLAEIHEDWADIVLLLLCFVTGLLDSAVFNVWSCFVSMQTGNTIYAGLGVSGQPKDQPWRWAKSLISIVFFVLGSFVFTRMMGGKLRRSTVVLSFAIQAILTFISAALVESRLVPDDAGFIIPENCIVMLPLALLAFQSAGQIVMSKTLGYTELTTVVLTSAYCDLFFDPKLAAPLRENPKRNRRIASAIILFAGAIAGGFLTQNDEINLALWVAGAIKSVIAIIWLFWRGKPGIQLE